MKKLSTFVYALFAVAAAVAAPTANEDFVIAEDAQTFTNAVNAAKVYTDAAIAALPPSEPPGNYLAVSNAAMNALSRAEAKAGYTEWKWADGVDRGQPEWRWDFGRWQIEIGGIGGRMYFAPVDIDGHETTPETTHICMWYYYTGYGDDLDVMNWDATRVRLPTMADITAATNGIPRITESEENPGRAAFADLAGKAVLADISKEAGDLASQSEVRSGDEIFAQLDAATTTNAQQSTQLTTLSGQVATIGAHLNAEDARFVVTNYNSVTHTPEAYVEIKLPDESWSRIWSEMTRWNYLFDEYLPTNYYNKAAVNAALNDKADRAWGFYDSTTGAYAPDGYTWISSEKIAIAANLAYQRTITSEGAIWVLESNGTVTETGGMTNGFFRISDDEGNSLFEIVKGNKRTVGADASSCQIVAGFSPTKLQIGYTIVSDVHPTLYVCESLTTQNWKAETDSDCVANVAWSGTSGAYVVQVQGKSAYTSLFVKATYEVGGETYISNAAPVSMQYMMINGVKYAVGTATISGNTVLTLTVAP